MLKKTFISSVIFLSASSSIYAKTTPYVGGGLGIGGYSQVSGWQGASANVFAGTGKLLDEHENIYIGGEVGANVSQNSVNNTTYGLSASVMPGLMLTKSTMLYAKAGLASDYKPNKSISIATLTGIGVQTNVAKHWDVRTEFISFGANTGNQANVGVVYKFD